jgi:L,D-transpeptidase YcbB
MNRQNSTPASIYYLYFMKKMAFLFFTALTFLNNEAFAEMPQSISSVQDHIRHFIENAPIQGRYKIDSELLYSSKVLPRFYVNREFQSGWLQHGHLSPEARLFVQFLENVEEHGLQPSDYHLKLIQHYRSKLGPYEPEIAQHLLKLDLLLTDAFMLVAAHLNSGKVDSAKIMASWKIQRDAPELMFDEKLETHLMSNSVVAYLEKLPGNLDGYNRLKTQLAFFKKLADAPWPVIKATLPLKPGESQPAITEIRKRLLILNHVVTDTLSEEYDDKLSIVVQEFQKLHGLNADGNIGKLTMDAFNLTPTKRIEAIVANLERMRWMPSEIPDRRIQVNIADYALELIDKKDTVLSMRAIVGKHYRATPVFNSIMTYLVISPGWVVPPTIFSNDVLPELKKGQDYLKKKNMQIVSATGAPVDYNSINWATVTNRNFPYMIRQQPGADNALGNIKFMFPNEYNVYIHDTPSRDLFDKDNRAFSSGCIRIARPMDLALYLLSDQEDWNEQRINNVISSRRETTVRFKQGIPVYITYFTAWSSGPNKFHFRTDLYNRDTDLIKALKEKPLASKL